VYLQNFTTHTASPAFYELSAQCIMLLVSNLCTRLICFLRFADAFFLDRRRRNSYSLPQRKRALPHKKQEELHRKKKKIFSYGRAHS